MSPQSKYHLSDTFDMTKGTVRCIVEFLLANGETQTLIIPNLTEAEVDWQVHDPFVIDHDDFSFVWKPEPNKSRSATLKITGKLKALDSSGHLYHIERKEPS